GMIGHQIQQDLQPAVVPGGEQAVEIRERAEPRIDADIIRNVITEVEHRRGKDWREPDRFDSELDQVGKSADDAGKIADPVVVRSLERARIDLIDDGGCPPWYRADQGLDSVKPTKSHPERFLRGRAVSRVPCCVAQIAVGDALDAR